MVVNHADQTLDAVSLGLWALFYFPPDFTHLHRVRSRWEEVKSIDYVGIVLFAGGLLLFLMGLSWGGAQYPWNSGHVIGTLVTGFVALVAFIFYGKCRPSRFRVHRLRLNRNIFWRLPSTGAYEHLQGCSVRLHRDSLHCRWNDLLLDDWLVTDKYG